MKKAGAQRAAGQSSLTHGNLKASRMVDQPEWEAKVKGLLKAELKKRNVTYAGLVDKLRAIGVDETEPNIRNKLARGKFTAVFLVQCLTAIGAERLALTE